MAFWNKKKDKDTESVSALQVDSSEEKNVESISFESLAAFNEKAEALFRYIPKEDAVVLPAALPSEQAKEDIPKDNFSLIVYVALNSAKMNTSAYLQFIKALEQRAVLEDRLRSLNVRIDRLSSDIHHREETFEEAKFENHFASLEDDSDEHEAIHENVEKDQDLYHKREALKESFLLLSKLEMNRVKIHKELIHILRDFNNKLPKVEQTEIQKARLEINKRINELKNIENVATSDGEKPKEEVTEEEMLAYAKNQMNS